ncbi:MAG: DNA-binding protein WhiA [Actinomycetota bacterium]
MSLTTRVKDELVAVDDPSSSIRVAEIATLMRFAGVMHLVSGKLAIDVELDHLPSAQRLRKAIHAAFGLQSGAKTSPVNANKKVETYLVRVAEGAEQLARNVGLIDARRRAVRGLPNKLTTAPIGDIAGVLRGAFLARGILSDPGRSQTIEIVAPTNEAAMALVGACGRVDISAKTRDVRGGFRVVIRDADAISSFLGVIGAPNTLAEWIEARATREVRANANRLVNFDDANLRRSAAAAVAACARVERAFEILGEGIPDHLAYAGKLRLDHREASLDELGHYANPIMTKDAVAGRIRRLLAMADKKASDLGIPNTSDGIPDLAD